MARPVQPGEAWSRAGNGLSLSVGKDMMGLLVKRLFELRRIVGTTGAMLERAQVAMRFRRSRKVTGCDVGSALTEDVCQIKLQFFIRIGIFYYNMQVAFNFCK